MEQDLCKNCIRARGMGKAVCPECHGENVQAWLEGPCMFLCCPDCGLEVIGGSFYAPCEQDDRKYELRIRSQSLTREQILAVGRYLRTEGPDPACRCRAHFGRDGGNACPQ